MKKYLLVIFSLLLITVIAGCNKKEESSSQNKQVSAKGNIQSMQVLNVEDYGKMMKEHIGKIVLVNFFGSWCPPCKAETPDFVEVYEKYKDKNNFVIIGIAVDDDQSKAIEFVNTYGVTYPVYQADRSLLSYFAISPIPTSFVFGKDGNLIDSMVGYMSKDIVERIAQFGGE